MAGALLASEDKNGSLGYSDREMNIVAAIEEWNRGLSPGALRIKYEKMGESAFAFFRCTNHLFWADFSGDDRLARFGNDATITWISGDCHVESFCASGNDTEGPMYGMNEFDEAIIADYQYDVWRLAISIVLLAKANGGQGLDESAQKAAVQAFARRYVRTVIGYRHIEEGDGAARLTTLLSYTAGNIKGRLVRFLAIVEREYSRRKMLKKWCTEDTRSSNSQMDFLPLKDVLQVCPKFEADAVTSAFGYYADTAQGEDVQEEGVNVKSVTRRLAAGYGSCGLPRYYVLTDAGDGEMHILDVKLQQKPTAYHFMRPEERQHYRARFPNDAVRAAEACRVLASSQDPFNGWIELKEDVHPWLAGFYSVRDLSPYEEPFPAQLGGEASSQRPKFRSFALTTQEALVELSEDWARILSSQHAHAACLVRPESVADQRPLLAREILQLTKKSPGGGAGLGAGGGAQGVGGGGSFEELVWEVAQSYAEQVQADWLAFAKHLLPSP
eukprot:TRINITY_DN32353_c0_g1_i1.p1 TRINITY_DN32353_c0_g1~~TRINITY_DN32353_c0_g1_i1.p1  ORF type:complete len:500 (+),score=101.15 TRINITY_DN32353_c0_g1_i1:471-1970(+)